VIIPETNRRDLMLKNEVVQAVRDGLFHIYAVSRVEEALEILTGKRAGRKRNDGSYPKNSLNFLIEQQLIQWNEIARKAAAPEKEKPAEHDEGPTPGAAC
jgi:predicted ATP-dependent protease